jgi:transposase-like protein
MNIIQIFKQFPTQESCIKHLEKARWGDKPICVYCGSTNTNILVKELRHHCNGCRKSFSVTVGTIFHHTHVPLQKWFLLIALMQNAKKGLSSCQAARDIEISQTTTWSMMHRIRKSMSDNTNLLSGIIEMDETYVGGKPRKENSKDRDNDDKDNPRGRGTKKTPVVGMVEREGKVKATSVSKHELKATDLRALILKSIDTQNSILITDEYTGYSNVSKIVPHETINHSYEYVRGDIHTNAIEGFWAILKRGLMGQFHWVSKKHLNAYIDEFCYRYNARELDGKLAFNMTINNMLKI